MHISNSLRKEYIKIDFTELGYDDVTETVPFEDYFQKWA